MRGGGGEASFASFDGNRDGFFNRAGAVDLVGQGSIGFQYEDECFFQVSFDCGECFSLRVDTGNFFDIAEVPLAALHINRCELSDHNTQMIPDK